MCIMHNYNIQSDWAHISLTEVRRKQIDLQEIALMFCGIAFSLNALQCFGGKGNVGGLRSQVDANTQVSSSLPTPI